ncbi:helix-turn-helix domain-containing protein [Paenibacillus sp. GCM10012303]|uniref:helix-turn-helix domain-containing protein n=1 Tax=Paenibacillus sp. GCM10012303 TaxID=3317340 RepID=UPI003605D964
MTKLRMMRVNKGLLQIFLALLLVGTIMFVSNYLVYKNSLSGIYNQVSENNKLVVKNMIRVFDDSFKDINELIYAIQLLPYNAWEAEGEGALSMPDAYMTYTNIRLLLSPIEYIEEVIVYHPSSDLAITAAGTIRLSELIRNAYGNSTYSADYWKLQANAKHPLRVYPAGWYEDSGQFGGMRQKLIPVLGSNQTSNMNVLIFLNNEKLMQHVNQQAMMQGTSLIVMDQDRNIVLNTEDNWDLVDMLGELSIGTKPEETLTKKDYEYNLFKSDYNGFLYINKSPYRFANMEAVTEVNRNIMAVAIACAIVLSVLLSFYLYRPVRSIVKLVGLRDQREAGADYRIIRSGIAKIQEENVLIKSQMDVFLAEMRKSAFYSALLDDSPSRETELRMQQYFAEFYKEPSFVLAVIDLRRIGERGQAESMRLEEKAKRLENGLRLALRRSVCVFPMTGRRLVAVIGLADGASRDAAVRQLSSFATKAQPDWLGEDTAEAAVCCVSRLYVSEAGNVHKAYREAEDGFLYRNVHLDRPVIDVQTIRYTWRVHVPLYDIEKAAHYLVTGNETECCRMLSDIFACNAEKEIHYHQLVPVAKTMFYRMLKLMETGEAETSEIIALEADFNRKLQYSYRQEDIQKALIGAVKFIASKANHGPKSKLDAASVAQYIEQHYSENLHLDHMAEKLETTPKYFSNYFKKTFGINFVEYVNKVRLSHAKEMLKHTDLPVADIGEKTGYLNSSTFTSTFKKYYGISPSEYRRNKQTDPVPLQKAKQ